MWIPTGHRAPVTRRRLLRIVRERRRGPPLLDSFVGHVAHHADADQDVTWPRTGVALWETETNGTYFNDFYCFNMSFIYSYVKPGSIYDLR